MSKYGRIDSAWELKGQLLTYKCEVPTNTKALFYLPTANRKTVKEFGKKAHRSDGVSFIAYETGKVVYKLEAGSYVFECDFLE